MGLLGCLALAAGAPGRGGEGPEAEGGGFQWHTRLEAARRGAAAVDGGLLVYFPPTDPGVRGLSTDAPPAWAPAGFPLAGLCVSAAEVDVLVRELGITEVPAIVVVDRGGGVALRAQGDAGPRAVAAAREALRRLSERDADARRTLEEAARLLERGARRAAWQRIAAVAAEARAPAGARANAEELSAALRRAERAELAAIVAREWRESGAEVGARLEARRKAWAHPDTLALVEAELAVLEQLTPGGR